MALLHATDRDRAGVQGTQARLWRSPASSINARTEGFEAHTSSSPSSPCLLCDLETHGSTMRAGTHATAIVEKFSTLQMVDVHLPTADGRHLTLPRHTQPTRDHQLLLHQLKLQLPEQPLPRISA